MKGKLAGVVLLLVSGMSANFVCAEPGERWEVTSKMDMAGMPFAMPAQALTVCIPKGKQGDPKYSHKNDDNCKMTDIKQSGNTVKFKGTCVQEGHTMEMSGETTRDSNTFTTKMHMTGNRKNGEAVDMTLNSTGKKLGGSCDTADQERAVNAYKQQAIAAQAQGKAVIAQACDTSSKSTDELILNNQSFLAAKPMCQGKKAAYCKAVSAGVAKDLNAFSSLQRHEQQIRDYNSSAKNGLVSIVQSCGIDMRSTIASLCKVRATKGPLDFLDSSCPAEAKAYRELARKQEECAGRGFTGASYGSDMKKCMGGQIIGDSESESSSPAAKAEPASANNEGAASSEATNEAIKQGTKALKGLLGF